MRKKDKLKNLNNANILLEERWLKNNSLTQESKTLNEEGSLLTEETVDDFFKFLARDPGNNTMASVYYTSPVKFNKFIKTEEGKEINPFYDKVLKNQRYTFMWGETYKDAVERTNPDHEFGQRRGTYEKLDGFKVTETGKSGLYLSIVPKGSFDAKYGIQTDNGYEDISKDEFQSYLPQTNYKPSSSGQDFRPLIVDRIYKIKAGGNEWVNPHYTYKWY